MKSFLAFRPSLGLNRFAVRMDNSILKTSPWKLFLFFIIGAILANMTAGYVAESQGWNLDYGAYPTLRFGLISLVWWTYPYLVGRALSQRSRSILIVFAIAIVNNFLSVSLTEMFGPKWYILMITVVVNFYCVFTVFAFPAMELKSKELNRDARFPEAWMETIQFMIWPISVWWLQNRLATRKGIDVK